MKGNSPIYGYSYQKSDYNKPSEGTYRLFPASGLKQFAVGVTGGKRPIKKTKTLLDLLVEVLTIIEKNKR